MNSTTTSHSQGIPPDCEIYIFLGGRLDHTTTEAYAVLVFLTVISIIACPLTTLLNALFMVAVKSKPHLRTKSNVALGCLATTDGILGVIGQPLYIALLILVIQGDASSTNCTLELLARNSLRVLGLASFFHLTLMNVDRYIAIKHSYEYIAGMVTEARILCSSALAWIATLLLTVPLAITDNDIYIAVNNITLSLCMAITIFCQVVLYFETRRHEKQIAAQQVSVEARQNFLKEKKALRLTTTVIFILALTYSPMIVVRALIVNSDMILLNFKYIALFTACSVLLLNSLINPIIYCIRIRQFRVAFLEVLLRKSNAEAEDIEMRVSGTLNAVAPLEQEEEREERQHDEQENTNNNNNDDVDSRKGNGSNLENDNNDNDNNNNDDDNNNDSNNGDDDSSSNNNNNYNDNNDHDDDNNNTNTNNNNNNENNNDDDGSSNNDNNDNDDDNNNENNNDNDSSNNNDNNNGDGSNNKDNDNDNVDNYDSDNHKDKGGGDDDDEDEDDGKDSD